ncbi:hypothetical protein [Zavarzinia sp. CC-PAN008]|uniref:hypothetical protein n=1 Tax=Zavarzinia sp. CC-PAN008 TaxID=3243332 RepID=UPI003F7469E2
MSTNVPMSVFTARGGQAIDPKVVSSIRQASQSTGVDFAYLMAKASLESNFQSDVKASSSSATGLYQFIEQTWLSMVKDHGSKYGLDSFASQITRGSDGRLTVADPAMRRQILDLRKDPQISAQMGAEYAALNEGDLEGALGREANATDLYVAHFMGSGGAVKFLKALARSPDASAASLFPSAAGANRSVFYNSAGQPRSVSQLYEWFGNKIGAEMAKFGNGLQATFDSVANALPAGTSLVSGSGSAGGPTRTVFSTVGTALAAPVLAPMTVVALASLSIPEAAAPVAANTNAAPAESKSTVQAALQNRDRRALEGGK